MAIERYQPNTVGPTTDFNTGQGTLANELAQASHGVEKIAEDWGGQLRAKQGEDAGAAAGESLNVDSKITSGMNEFTAYGKAYTNAAEAAYSARTKTDMISTIDRLKLENQTDPGKFAELAGSAMDGLIAPADPRIQPFLKLFARGQITAGTAEIGAKVHEWNLQQGVADTMESDRQLAKATADAVKGLSPADADKLITSASDSVASEWHAHANSHAVHPVIAEHQIQEFHKELYASVSGEKVGTAAEGILTVAKMDVTAASQKLAALTDPSNNQYTGQEKASIASMVENGINMDHQNKIRVFGDAANQVAIDLASGGYDSGLVSRIQKLARMNVFTPLEESQHLGTVARNLIAVQKKKVDFGVVDDIFNGKALPGSPADKEYTGLVNQHFDQMAVENQLQPMSDRWINTATYYMQKTNVIPKSVEYRLQTAAMSRDPVQASIAANAYEKLHEANPTAALFQEDPRMAPLLTQISMFTRNGQSPESAYKMAFDNTFNTSKEQKDVLEKLYLGKGDAAKRNAANAHDLQTFVDSSSVFGSNGFFSHFQSNNGRPRISIDDEATYNTLKRDAFMATGGNESLSTTIAQDAFRANYGVTTVNGFPELLKHAPELRYPDLKPEVIRADIDNTVREAGWHPKFDNVTPQFAPAEEQKYRAWLEKIGHTPDKGFAVDRNATGMNYDYRGFFQKYGPVDVAQGQHLTDEFKLPNHPTFSDQSKYAAGDNAKYAGSWAGEAYMPPIVSYASEHRIELAANLRTDFTRGEQWALVDKNGNAVVTNLDGTPLLYVLPTAGRFPERLKAARDQATIDTANKIRESIDANKKASQDWHQYVTP